MIKKKKKVSFLNIPDTAKGFVYVFSFWFLLLNEQNVHLCNADRINTGKPILHSYDSLFRTCSHDPSQKKWMSPAWVFICCLVAFQRREDHLLLTMQVQQCGTEMTDGQLENPDWTWEMEALAPTSHKQSQNRNNLWVWIMGFLVVPLFITSFVQSLLPSTIYSMFSMYLVLHRIRIWNGVENKWIPRFMYLIVLWKSETKLRKEELHSVVSNCLGSGVWLLGLRVLPQMAPWPGASCSSLYFALLICMEMIGLFWGLSEPIHRKHLEQCHIASAL